VGLRYPFVIGLTVLIMFVITGKQSSFTYKTCVISQTDWTPGLVWHWLEWADWTSNCPL